MPNKTTLNEKLELLIDGVWRQGSTGVTEDVINPATEEVIGILPHASAEDMDEALNAAEKAFIEWRNTSAWKRGDILKEAAKILRDRADHVAELLTLEQGKTLPESKGEVIRSVETIEWFAEEGKRAYGRIIPGRDNHSRNMMVTEPVGVVLSLTPWNFPIITPVRKMAAALAAGCTVIAKPSEETPATGIALARAFTDAGLPAGALNVVFGVPDTVSRHFIGSGCIRKLSFTGSIPVGKHLAALAAQHMIRCTFELGGHSPVLVFEDADVEDAAKQLAGFKFRNAGQVCISPTRFYVQDSVHDQFSKIFIDYAKSLTVGNGMDKNVQMGPLANSRRLDAMDEFVQDARDHGATIATGGKRMGNKGYFYEPTVMTEVPEEARIMNDEPFGPLAPIVRFTNIDDVIEQANRLPYGLASYSFTGSSKTAARVADALETGMVGINSVNVSLPETPFGGVKESGYGHECAIEGLEVYLNHKFITQVGT
jgi:succinate-semialdehyde dehydrogenase/glutarate-semialdehyde dehydrogenase